MDGTTEIWQWIASGLLAVLGWILGRKGLASNSYNSWETSKEAINLRIKQLEDLTTLRSEHPEFHPLSNYVNGQLGKFDNRIHRVELHCFGDEEEKK